MISNCSDDDTYTHVTLYIERGGYNSKRHISSPEFTHQMAPLQPSQTVRTSGYRDHEKLSYQKIRQRRASYRISKSNIQDLYVQLKSVISRLPKSCVYLLIYKYHNSSANDN